MNIEDEIRNLLGDEDEGAASEEYKNVIRALMRTAGVSAVVYQFMAIRFSDLSRDDDEAQHMASTFMMGLQMADRHPEWARVVVEDVDDIDSELREVSHTGQDSLFDLLPVD